MALSNLLKTGTSFGFQPVVFDDKLLEMLDFYLKYVRPLLRAVLSKAALEDPVSFLWPDWNASMLPAPSDMVQRYCKSMGLQITATTIRSLWEMKVEWMYQNGVYEQHLLIFLTLILLMPRRPHNV